MNWLKQWFWYVKLKIGNVFEIIIAGIIITILLVVLEYEVLPNMSINTWFLQKEKAVYCNTQIFPQGHQGKWTNRKWLQSDGNLVVQINEELYFREQL